MLRRSTSSYRYWAVTLGFWAFAGCGGSTQAAAPVADASSQSEVHSGAGGGGVVTPSEPAGGAGASVAGTGSSGAGAAASASEAGAGNAEIAAGAGAAGASAGESAAGTGLRGAAGVGQTTAGTGSEPGTQGFRCPAGPFEAPALGDVSVERVAGLPPLDAFNDNGNMRTNIEGPVWIGDKLYVSEFLFVPTPDSRILALDPSGAVTVALAHSASNGLAVDASGALIATDHKRGAVVRMTFPLGTPEVLVSSYDGKRFNSPNDLAVRSDGTIYFSDPDYQAPNEHPQEKTRLYALAPGSGEATVIDDSRSEPNGVTLSADEHTLYVAGTDGIFTYSVLDDGRVAAGSSKRIDAFNGASDGLAMDCAGNLYATAGQRIVVLSPQGMQLGVIAVPQAESLTNVAFGGPVHKTLFITGMGSGEQRGVFRAELNVPGFPY